LVLGGRQGREKALAGYEKVAIGAALFGLALAARYLVSLGVSVYAQMAGMAPAVDVYNSSAALSYAYGIYHEYFSGAATALGTFFAALAVLNTLQLTQGYGMAILQAAAPVLTALSTILILSGTYSAASLMAMGWAPLAALGAVGVAYERTRNLGAFALSLASVTPAVLAVGAETIYNAVKPSALNLGSDVIRALTAGLIDVGQLIALAMYLSVLGIVLSALIYGFSRIFDEVGSHFALE
jgi:hypothetical protein